MSARDALESARSAGDEQSRYVSPLAERYASPEMLALWSPRTRHGLWRRIWLALAEGERALGADVSEAAIAEMRAQRIRSSQINAMESWMKSHPPYR